MPSVAKMSKLPKSMEQPHSKMGSKYVVAFSENKSWDKSCHSE